MDIELPPHIDRFVGKLPPDISALDVSHELEEYVRLGGEKLKPYEVEKTERDIQLIDFVNQAVDKYLVTYGRNNKVEIPPENIHVLYEGGLEQFSQGKSWEGKAYQIPGSIIVDRAQSDRKFTHRLFHELLHLKCHIALQFKNEKNELEHPGLAFAERIDKLLEIYRSGITIRSRDGKVAWFQALEEGILQFLQQKFDEEYIQSSELFEDEKEPEVGKVKSEHLKFFLDLTDTLWEARQKKFNDDSSLKTLASIHSKEDVINLFIRTQVTGRLLPLARFVKLCSGKRMFRELGEDTGYDLSNDVPKSLKEV